jgi:hypothetical protein
VKKGQIFWIAWAAVVAAIGAFYFFVVYPKSSENSALYATQGGLAARFLPGEALTKDIIKEAEAVAAGKRPPGKVTLLAEDKLLWGIYPLSNNLKKIPNEFTAKAKRDEDKALVEERGRFVERFKDYQFSVDLTLAPGKNRDFPEKAPPGDVDLFMDWVTRDDGQDARTDKEFLKIIAEREKDGEKKSAPVIIFQKSRAGGQPEWLEDGRFSGTVTRDEFPKVRPEILKRLVLRRLVLTALAQAEARVATLQMNPEGVKKGSVAPQWKPVVRRVQFIEKISFLDAKRFVQERRARLGGSVAVPKEVPLPYRATGVELRVKCHAAVVPALLKKLEEIGADHNRPFAFWVERLAVQRAPGKPDWEPKESKADGEAKGEAKSALPDPLPVDFGYRYGEWPVSVDILGVIPEFDETLDPLPTAKG